MKFVQGNFYTLTEDNGVEKPGFTFMCENILEDGMAQYGDCKYRVLESMCRNATTIEIIKMTARFTHPSDLIEKGKMFDVVFDALKSTHKLYVVAVKDKYLTHDITRVSSNDLIIEEAEKL